MSTASSASSNSSSASRSSSAAAASRATAAPSAAPKAATTKPTDEKSCHLAKPSQTQTLRGDLDSFAKQHPSSYSSKVRAVNEGMRQLGIGISPCSHQSIKDSLKGVAQGTMTEKQAHAREAASFAKDSFESFSHGNISQGVWESVGSGLNAAAARLKGGRDHTTGPASGGGGVGGW